MLLKPAFYQTAGAGTIDRTSQRPQLVCIKRTLPRMGPLGIVAGIVVVVYAGVAQRRLALRPIERHPRMPKRLQRRAAMGTGDRRRLDRLAAFGTLWHSSLASRHWGQQAL